MPNKKSTTGGIRISNLLIRSQTLYPLGHAAMYPVCQLYLLLLQLPSVVPCNNFLVRTFLCVKQKVDHRRYWKLQSSDSKSDALSVGPCGHVSCQLYLLLHQLPGVVPCIDFLCKNFLLLRSQTPYPLGHAAMRPCILSIVSVTSSVAKCCPLY